MYAGDPSTPPAQNLGLIPTRLEYLSRVYPRATDGTLDDLAYDPADHSFTMTATAAGAGPPTIIFIPYTVHGKVTVSGPARVANIVREPDGTRFASVTVTGPGAYTVTVQ